MIGFVVLVVSASPFCCILESWDSKAPMAFITASDFPQLYAVVFGEGVLNDVPFLDKQKLG